MTLVDYALWPFRQASGTLSNLWAGISGAKLSDVLPPSWVGTILFVRDSFPRSIGFADSAWQQLSGVIVFTIVMIVASFGILTTVAIFYGPFFGTLALLRFVPAINSRWPWGTSDWPLWEVK